MVLRRFRESFAPLAIVAAMLSACGQDASDDTDIRSRAEVFSAEDRRVASALSLGNVGVSGEQRPPGEEAVLCRHLIAELEDRMEAAGALNEEIERGFAMGKAAFDSSIEALHEGRPARDGVALAEGMSAAERGRTALGCIRKLEAET